MRKAYNKYQSTNEKWMKTIPSHWSLKRLKGIFYLRKESNNPIVTREILSLTAKQGVIPYKDKIGVGGNKPKSDLTKYNICHVGDLLVNNMNVVSGAAGVSKYMGCVSPVYYPLVLRNNSNCWYYHYIFKLLTFQRSLIGLGKGILMHENDKGTLTSVRMRISMDYLGNVQLPVPPREEQDQIVRFLDWKVSSINKLINIKQQEITELKKLKKATISDAVTHGFDKTVPMKDSGIVWLGNIPKHWKLMRGKNLYLKLQRPVRKDDEVVTCFRDGTVTLRKHRRTTGFTEAINETGYQGIRKGDLIIHVMDAFAGSIGVSDSDGKGTPVYSVCQAKINLNNEYYAFLLREMARSGFIQSLYRGIRERSSDFRFEVFANQYYSVPPRNEQDQIARFLDARCADIDRLIAAKQTQITNLHDLKSSLIVDVVTGKIDVRDVEIPDYEQVAESLYEADDNATLHSEDEIPEEV